MTKAKSKAARRKLKRAITLAGGQTAPQRPTGRDRRHTNQPEEAADLVALASRARRTGCSMEDARDVLAGEDMGRCIRSMRPGIEDRRALLGVWQGISAAWANYCARCLSITPTPQAAALPMLSEPMETDQSLRVDLRTGNERDEAARRVWFEWLDLLMTIPADQRNALRGHLQGYGADVWDSDTRQPTRAGTQAIKALDALHVARGG